MKEEIEKLMEQVRDLTCANAKEVEEARVRLLGKKGEITRLFEEFRSFSPDLKREFGKKINELKQAATSRIEALKEMTASSSVSDGPKEDLSMPGTPVPLGSRHPVSIVRQQIVDIFRKFGYGFEDYDASVNYYLNHPHEVLYKRLHYLC
jgi:phenylalanyl-tRNA synthetase alpha chain